MSALMGSKRHGDALRYVVFDLWASVVRLWVERPHLLLTALTVVLVAIAGGMRAVFVRGDLNLGPDLDEWLLVAALLVMTLLVVW